MIDPRTSCLCTWVDFYVLLFKQSTASSHYVVDLGYLHTQAAERLPPTFNCCFACDLSTCPRISSQEPHLLATTLILILLMMCLYRVLCNGHKDVTALLAARHG